MQFLRSFERLFQHFQTQPARHPARLLWDASVNELMEPFDLTSGDIQAHQGARSRGLISRSRIAQKRRVASSKAVKDVAEWIDHYRHFWAGSFDRLEPTFKKCKLTQRRKMK